MVNLTEGIGYYLTSNEETKLLGMAQHAKAMKTQRSFGKYVTHATIGRSGLTPDDMRLRVKRWLIAGLDDGAWPEDTRRTQHVAMGGMHLIEFAAGLSEEACDRIAAALPPPP